MSDTREVQPARDGFWHDLRSSRGSYTAKASLSGGIGLLASLGGCGMLAMFLRLKGFVEGLIEAHSLHCSTVQGLLLLLLWCAIFSHCYACSRLDRSPATEVERTLGCCLGSHFDDVLLWLVTKREGKVKRELSISMGRVR